MSQIWYCNYCHAYHMDDAGGCPLGDPTAREVKPGITSPIDPRDAQLRDLAERVERLEAYVEKATAPPPRSYSQFSLCADCGHPWLYHDTANGGRCHVVDCDCRHMKLYE